MSFTRFHDDPCRVKKQLQESTDQGLYYLNVPGNGTNMPFIEDPHIRLQQWGANLRTNTIGVESDLMGLTRRLNEDCENISKNNLTDDTDVDLIRGTSDMLKYSCWSDYYMKYMFDIISFVHV